MLTALNFLPISYCVLVLHIASCMFNNATFACKIVVNGRRSSTFNMGIITVLSLLLKGCVVAFLFIEQPELHCKMTEGKEAYIDPLVSSLINLGTLSPTGKYYLGMICASIAGVSLSIGHFIGKSTFMTEEHPSASAGLKKIGSSMCSLIMAITLFTVFQE